MLPWGPWHLPRGSISHWVLHIIFPRCAYPSVRYFKLFCANTVLRDWQNRKQEGKIVATSTPQRRNWKLKLVIWLHCGGFVVCVYVCVCWDRQYRNHGWLETHYVDQTHSDLPISASRVSGLKVHASHLNKHSGEPSQSFPQSLSH